MSLTTVATNPSPASRPVRGRPLFPWVRRLLGSPLLEALTSPHGVSRYLELVSPLWSLDETRAVVLDVHRETRDAVTLTLRPSGTLAAFRAGQFVKLTVEVDGVRRTRCYSVSCSEHREEGSTLRITVKAHPHGTVSQYLHQHAAPGLVVGLSPADGEFTLPAERPDRLLLISGGSGITPVMSMLRTLCDEGHDRPVTFLHYARTPEDVIFGQELQALAERHDNVSLVTVFTRSEPGPESRSLRGHFERGHLEAVAPDFADTETYVCGPLELIDSVRTLYTAEGLAERLHVEQFEPPATPAPDDTATGEVRFETSQVAATNDGRTLLEQAEAAGLTPEYGCRMGVCHTCTRPLNAGQVRHIRSGEVCSEAGTNIRLCVHAPVGDVSVDL